MLIIKDKADINIDYDLSKITNPQKTIFFDIETTGFSRKHNTIYLIGCMYYENGELYFTQYFAEHPKEESIILQEFYKKITYYDTIIHFNGHAFDMPFVKERGSLYNIDFVFDSFQTIDLYKKIKPFSHVLKLENTKQKTIEKLCGIHRKDPFSGGDLIEVYKEYIHSKDERLLKALLMHNMEDVFYMGKLTSILAFTDMIEGDFAVNSFETCTFQDFNRTVQKELKITLQLDSPLPFFLSHKKDTIYITGKDKVVNISSKIEKIELKFFISNYKDYYYLPTEDMAMHKSVSSYVDKNYRKNATPATCYLRKCDDFIYLSDHPSEVFNETFKSDYKEKNTYICINCINEDTIDSYVKELIKNI